MKRSAWLLEACRSSLQPGSTRACWVMLSTCRRRPDTYWVNNGPYCRFWSIVGGFLYFFFFRKSPNNYKLQKIAIWRVFAKKKKNYIKQSQWSKWRLEGGLQFFYKTILLPICKYIYIYLNSFFHTTHKQLTTFFISLISSNF